MKLTEEGMNRLNEVACDNDLTMLVLFINGASFEVFHKIHKLDESEARLTVSDMDFANMLQILIEKVSRERGET
ncbi:hypothetical protein [Desulfonema ishimotonii]|uniref:hypothetical protein n=1 Tax=Desulfonema ishimotonii TaxID=45657 RepID=UPI000F55C026|nr:hypothetical protein [Desulfonema ishimotonii]